MKRHAALVPLSHDHHQVLVIAQQLRRATTDTSAQITRRFRDAWESEEKPRFSSR